MHRADRITHGKFCDAAVFFCTFSGLFHIAQIIQCIKNTNNVYSVFNAFLNKFIYHIICIVTVT